MSQPGLQAIHAAGGVVPPGLLARIQAGELKDPAGLAPSSYHLVGRETVRDAASRAWSYLRGAWTAWRDHIATQPSSTSGIAAARERWLLVLLRELGYGQLPALSGGYTIDERHYPVSHAWQHVPIHLLGPGVDLNHRNPHVPGAARAPQAMVQELLNRSDTHLWGILSNGLRLRLLRDSTALAGSAYLEFDLETIFDGELYPEFLLMWQLCHVSRLEQRPTDADTPASPAGCWLEVWRGEAAEAGTRMLDRLRDGVAAALTALGTGFIRHPANRPIVEALRDGTLSTDQYHRALLRLAYRLLFCFVAEDRDALLHPGVDRLAHERYTQYFSTARLRRLSRTRSGSPHPDLWQAQTVVLRALGGDGHAGLGLPPLAGLFDPDPHLPSINGLSADPLLGCALTNEDLLAAVRKLAWVALPGQRVQPVDYRNLGAEELGSVYESLLELIPRVDLTDRTFHLDTLSGNERKTTGSYYTPPSLVSALLDTALDPLLDDATADSSSPADAEARLLALTVCDPACGSGHFLVAAARRIARRLAQVRSGDDEPTPAQIQHALRDAIGHCIYGVDLNDLAAELTKVSLWMEALEPGKPLGFLDARIRVGNSLLGATPALLRGSLPDEAFGDLEGDDKKTASAVRKRNKAQAVSKDGYAQDLLFAGGADPSNADLAARRAALLDLPDDVDSVRAQASRWERHERSPEYRTRRVHADTWCAAFVWPMPPAGTSSVPEPPTNGIMRAIADNPLSDSHAEFINYAEHIAVQYRFFHWHLEFPEIFKVDGDTVNATPQGWSGGFSCVLGNPPWDKIELDKKEFFASRDPRISQASNDAARDRLISALAKADPVLYGQYQRERRRIEAVTNIVRNAGRYALTSSGRLNTYAVFAEAGRSIMSRAGRFGMIVPTGIATDSTTRHFFRDLIDQRALIALYDFENEEKLFADVNNRPRFSLLCLTGGQAARILLAFRLRQPDHIRDRAYEITPDEILLLNPNTGTCPVFASRRDAELAIGVYRRIPVLWRDGVPDGNPWDLTFAQGLFNMATGSKRFLTVDQLQDDGWTQAGKFYRLGGRYALPLYEAKMAHHYDHRFATYDGATQAQINKGTLPRLDDAAHADPALGVLPHYWVPETLVDEKLAGDEERGKLDWPHDWLLGWRDVARATEERTFITTVIPRVAVGHKYLLAFPHNGSVVCLQANLSAFVLDYIARQKLSGASMGYFITKQLPVLPPDSYRLDVPWLDGETSLESWIRVRVLELSFNAYDMQGYARKLGDHGGPFVWMRDRRMRLRAELDAAYFHLYGINRDDVDYVMDSFNLVRDADEKVYGEYRTKRKIIEIYDAMQHATDTGKPYASVVDPPPGHGARHAPRDEVRA